MSSPIRVLIADDHKVVAQALSDRLNREPDIEIVGTSHDGDAAVRDAERTQPDVILMDVRMPGMNGVDAARLIRDRRPDTKVVILTGAEEEQLIIDAIEAGASGYLTKERAMDEVIGAVRAAHNGEILLPAAQLQRLLSNLRDRKRKVDDDKPMTRLTEREREVLREIATGSDNNIIADRLVISPHTLRTHIQNIMHKLDAHSKLEAVTIALRQGLIELPRSV